MTLNIPHRITSRTPKARENIYTFPKSRLPLLYKAQRRNRAELREAFKSLISRCLKESLVDVECPIKHLATLKDNKHCTVSSWYYGKRIPKGFDLFELMCHFPILREEIYKQSEENLSFIRRSRA